MAHIHLDQSKFPIVLTEMEGRLEPEQAEAYCEEMAEVIRYGRPFATVTDLTRATMPSLKVRTVFRKLIEEYKEESDRYTICAALVIDNAVVRMGVEALYHLKKTTFPQKVFKTREEAMSWAKKQIQAHCERADSES